MEQAEASARLREAIVARDGSLMKRLLDSNPTLLQNPNFADKSNTSLHLAAQYGHADIAEYLISLGHDREANHVEEDYLYSPGVDNLGLSINTDGQCPLHIAAANSNAAVAKVLCRHFPHTVHRADNEGATPLHLASSAHATPSRSDGPGTARTAHGGEDTSVIEVLLAHGADVNAKDKLGNTCLHNATAWGNLKTVRLLMLAGADMQCQNRAGWTPEYYSITVQAEVYYRNLAAEVEQLRAGTPKTSMKQVHGGQAQSQRSDRRLPGAGAVRLVSNDDDDEEEDYYEDDEEDDDDDDDDDEDNSSSVNDGNGGDVVYTSMGSRSRGGTGEAGATASENGLGISLSS